LRAAERGVRVRVIVDDLLIDAPDKSLLALAMHPTSTSASITRTR
jgi:cardiolipin synthase C